MQDHEVPPPPYPPEIQAKGWRFELAYEQIERSDTWALGGSFALDGKPLARPLLLAMWYAAWKQAPAGSLPSDERLIAAAMGVPTAIVAEYREVLMRGWWKASDGRIYHPTLVERVLEMVRRRRSDADRQATRRARQAGAAPDESQGRHDESRVTYGAQVGPSRVTGPPNEDLSRVTPPGVRGESSTGTGTDIAPTEPIGSYGAAHAGEADAEKAEELAKATRYGAISGRLRKAGVHDASPHMPRFRALVDADVTADEFLAFSDKAMTKAPGAPFAYLLGAVEGERTRAAAMKTEIHHGPLPSQAAQPAPRPHVDAKATQELLRRQTLPPEQIEANRQRAAQLRRERNLARQPAEP